MSTRSIKDIIRPAVYAYYGQKYRSSECQEYLASFSKIPSVLESIETVAKSGNSLARFGDGEFNWIFGRRSASFQKSDESLSKRLKEVLLSQCPSLEITIPGALNTNEYSKMSKDAQYFWRYWIGRNWNDIKILLKECNTSFLSTDISRPYIQFLDYDTAMQAFSRLKSIWMGKRILVIEGTSTNLGVYTDLFESCACVRRILCPPRNAFDCYSRILNCILRRADSVDLVLISLGPTATILAYDLAIMGVQALDIGHIDVEYEWCLRRSLSKEPLLHHAVAECRGGFDCGYEGKPSEVVDLIEACYE